MDGVSRSEKIIFLSFELFVRQAIINNKWEKRAAQRQIYNLSFRHRITQIILNNSCVLLLPLKVGLLLIQRADLIFYGHQPELCFPTALFHFLSALINI